MLNSLFIYPMLISEHAAESPCMREMLCVPVSASQLLQGLLGRFAGAALPLTSFVIAALLEGVPLSVEILFSCNARYDQGGCKA